MRHVIKIGDHRITDPPDALDGFDQGMQGCGIIECLDVARFGNPQHQQLRQTLA